MSNGSKEIKTGPFDFFSDIFKYNVRKIDAESYKHVAIFFLVALFLAVVAYSVLRISQEWIANRNAKKAEPPAAQSQNVQQANQTAVYDQQRKNDVFILNSALKAYFLDKEESPAALEDLKPGFIKDIPNDPEKKTTYIYQVSSDKKTWKVSAQLSDGSAFELSGP